MSRQYLADAVAVQCETVTKILSDFEAARLVVLGRRRVQVLDTDGLRGRCAV